MTCCPSERKLVFPFVPSLLRLVCESEGFPRKVVTRPSHVRVEGLERCLVVHYYRARSATSFLRADEVHGQKKPYQFRFVDGVVGFAAEVEV